MSEAGRIVKERIQLIPGLLSEWVLGAHFRVEEVGKEFAL